MNEPAPWAGASSQAAAAMARPKVVVRILIPELGTVAVSFKD
jgi:hypothetical protein